MDIADASTFFDNDSVYDGYTGEFLFDAQVASFDDSHSDGATNRRRVLSTGPDVVIPTRRVVSINGDRWVVGNSTPDGFMGEVVRKHQSMKRVTDLMSLLTPGELLTNAAGTSVYVHKYYFKDTADALDSAEIDTFWNIFLAPGETAAKGSFFKDAGGRLYRVRNDYLPVEGLRVCQSDTLDEGSLQSVVWVTDTYNPITDTMGPATTTVTGVWFDTPKFYRFRHVSDPMLAKGDIALFVPTTITPMPGDEFSMEGHKWRAMSVQAEKDAWAVHARRG